MGAYWYRNKIYDGTYTEWSDAVPLPYSGKWGNLLGDGTTPAVGFELKAGDTEVTFKNAYFTSNGQPNWVENPQGKQFTLTPGDQTVYTLAELAEPYPFTDLVYVYVDVAAGADEECQSNEDCEQGEKCEDGECVPCDKIVDGRGTLTLYGTHNTNGTFMTDAHQREWVGSNSHEFYMEGGSPYAGVLVIPNGIQAHLKIHVFYGFTGGSIWSKIAFEGDVNQQKIEFNYPPAGNLPFGCLYSSKVLVEVTNYTNLGDCADDLPEPEEPVKPEPPEGGEPETPPEPEEEDPIDKEEHEGEEEKPVKPDKPDEPQNCDCENYIANSVQVGSDQIFDMLGSLKDSIDRLSNNLTKDIDRVSLSINQAANLNNLALSAINTNLYNLLMFLSDKMYKEFVEFRKDFKNFGFYDETWISEILHQALIHPSPDDPPSKGSVEYFKKLSEDFKVFREKFQEFSDSYEPVQIENEYRVQSRRTENIIEDQ